MNTPNFHTNNIFSNTEKVLLQQMIDQLKRGCDECNDCELCIFNKFCESTIDGCAPGETIEKIVSILGVNL